MAGDTDNLVLEPPRHIRGSVDRIEQDVRELRGRVGNMEAAVALMSQRRDRTVDDLHEIRTRLVLVEA